MRRCPNHLLGEFDFLRSNVRGDSVQIFDVVDAADLGRMMQGIHDDPALVGLDGD